jgi:hypothetical protein
MPLTWFWSAGRHEMGGERWDTSSLLARLER